MDQVSTAEQNQGNAFLAAQLGYAVFTAKVGKRDPYLAFRGIPFTRLADNVLHRAIGCIPMTLILLFHASLLICEDEPKSLP